MAALAIVLGVWSHLLWDSFTHRDGWIVHRVSALSAPFTLGPYEGTVCHALQYLSSAIGLCVLVLWYARLPAPAAEAGRDAARSAAGPVLLLVAVAAVLIGGVQGLKEFTHTHSVYSMLYVLLTHGLTWFAALYLSAGIVLARGSCRTPWPSTRRASVVGVHGERDTHLGEPRRHQVRAVVGALQPAGRDRLPRAS